MTLATRSQEYPFKQIRQAQRRCRIAAYVAVAAALVGLFASAMSLIQKEQFTLHPQAEPAWTRWWNGMNTSLYQGRLTDQDRLVVESCAKRLNITPDRVIRTVVLGTKAPAVNVYEQYPREEADRYMRIQKIWEWAERYPETFFALRHAGRSRREHQLAGQPPFAKYAYDAYLVDNPCPPLSTSQ
jgi:hypothetical protein